MKSWIEARNVVINLNLFGLYKITDIIRNLRKWWNLIGQYIFKDLQKYFRFAAIKRPETKTKETSLIPFIRLQEHRGDVL